MLTYFVRPLQLLLLLVSTPLMSQNIPSSKRAEKAIKNNAIHLQSELNKMQLTLGNSIYLRIFKQEEQLEVWMAKQGEFKLFKTYPVCTFGFGGLGPKLQEGDGKAPEGFYFVKANQLNPHSSYHLSFNLGYPNAYDRAHGRTGSALMVHGDCVSVGCYAMTDDKIEEIYTLSHAALSHGQDFFRVHIFPFRMSKKNMEKHQDSKWIGFWKNLKQGYDYFQHHKKPPTVEVSNRRYVFAE